MGRTLVLTGIEPEARALARALGLSRRPGVGFAAFERGDVRVGVVGLGACALDARWDVLVAGWPRAVVVSAGVCGGLDPALRAGDLVLPEEVLAAGGERLEVATSISRVVLHDLSGTRSIPRLATSERVLGTPELKAACRARTGAAAVDMESAAILRRALTVGWPALVVRAVSEAAGETVPRRLVGLVSADGRVRPGQAMATVVTSPRVLRDALRLQRGARRALRAVARALVVLAAMPE